MDHTRTVADNIKALRKSAGMTQRRLAERANVSLSLLSKVETDDRPASHAFVAAVARALRVPIERVYGQPYGEFDSAASVDALRVALRGYDLPSETGTVPRPREELEADVREISELRRNGRYARLAARLPAIIEELTLAVHDTDSAGRVRAFQLLVSVYYASHGLAYRLGYADLAESIEHKLIWAAEQSGDPLAAGLAQWTRVTTFQSAGDYGRGLRILDAARGQLTDELSGNDQAAVTVYGSMHLRAVTLASRAGDATTTRAHLDAAYELLRRAPTDSVHYHLTYGPANVRIHDVAASVELGEPEQAVERGRGFEPPRGMPATRAGHHYIDLAHAHVLLEDRAGTLAALESARRLAPEQTRYHPMVRETTRALIGLHRRANPELIRFTTWLGLAT
ncbi:helix-turn-helix domain-containing protein [Longispora urticae]